MASFGTRLKQEREQRRISLEEISQSTKISTRFLHALEDEKFEQLPGGIFNKGFIRAYASHLGLDEEEMIASYLLAAGMVPVEKKPEGAVSQVPLIEARPEPPSGTTGLPWGLFAVALLVVALGFAVWSFYSREAPKTGIPAVSERGKELLPAAAPVAPSVVPAEATAELKTTLASRPATAPAPSSPSRAPDNAPGVSKDAAATTGKLVLHITAREDSWISITSDGREVMRGTFVAPGDRTIHGDKEISVRAGNVGALDFEFDGRKLPVQGDLGEVKTLTFDANGLRPAPPTPQAPIAQP